MVCGQEKIYVNGFHLKKHGLTVPQYKAMGGQIYSQEYWQRRTYIRLCRLCGAPFSTHNPKTVVNLCQRCRAEAKKRYYRLRDRLRRRSPLQGKRQWLGTFGENYLSIENGHVNGAALLKRGVSYNGRPSAGYNLKDLTCESCGSNMIANVVDGELYCSECGAPIILAKENERYSMPIEPTCASCGLVYAEP